MKDYARVEIVNALEQIAQYGTAPKGYADMLDVGTAPFLDYFNHEVINDLLRSGGATCKIVAGPYGSGKSHLLDLLRDAALLRGLVVVHTDLSQALSLEDWRILTRHILQNMEALVDGVPTQSLFGILDALKRSGRADASVLGGAPLAHPGFARAMATTIRDARLPTGAYEPLKEYLSGEAIPAKAFACFGIKGIKNALNRRNAESVLRTVVGGLHRLGVDGVLLLFDENEKTFSLPRGGYVPPRVSNAANFLRRLIDATAGGQVPGMAAVLTVLPTFVDTCAAVYPALGQRVQLRGGNSSKGAWRWPYLSIEAVAPEMFPDVFVERLAERLASLVEQQCGQSSGLSRALAKQGLSVLENHAGQDYRRYVSKALALTALKQMES